MTKNEKTTGRMPNAALMKPVQPDDALAVIVGSTPLPRGELTKKLWDYIKKNKLQDEKKRTLINADDALKVVLGGKKQVSMFEMTKLVSGHGAVRSGDCRARQELTIQRARSRNFSMAGQPTTSQILKLTP